jgi:hypothetical protein
MRIALCAVVALLAITPSTCGQTWDSFADFGCANPNGAWSYGWRLIEWGPSFIPMSACISAPSCPIDIWHEPSIAALSVGRPVSGSPSCATWTCPAGHMLSHPGPGTEYAVLRWTAPAAAQVTVNVTFVGMDYSYPTTTACSLMHNGSGLWGVSIASYGVPYPHSEVVNVAAGDTIEAVIGNLGNFTGDATALTLTIVAAPCPSASVASLGAGCSPAGPQLSSTPPQIGSTVTLSVTGAPPSASGVLFAGAPAPALPVGGGCSVHRDVATIFEVAPITTDGAGNWSVGVVLPNALALAGTSVGLQGIVLLPAPPGFVLTGAILATIGC